MSPSLVLLNRQRKYRLAVPYFRGIIAHCLQREWPGCHFQLAIYFIGEAPMARLNQTWLAHQGPTDVITFDYRESAARALIGEIFVCVPVAVRQAAEFGVTCPAELVRYAVHGLLHLAGHDDTSPKARAAMKRQENRIVRRLASHFVFSRIRFRPVKR